jgi:DNA-damage-inducible protein J
VKGEVGGSIPPLGSSKAWGKRESKFLDNKNTRYILCIMKTTTSVKLDKEVKDQASKLATELGLNLSSVINATLKRFVIERRVSFSAEPELNEKSKKELREAMEDVKNSKNLVGPFSNISDLKKSLLG